ncbi:Uncharacterised protein [Mycobacteroides abscessus subsp. abscessus]|nr:Uncharacterised protein [Mycobacteroides abscessus subsp. abscessus]
MTIINTGPSTIPQKPKAAIPEKTANSISAGSRRAPRGTRKGRNTLSILETTSRCQAMTNSPPTGWPKRIMPIPNGMVTMPPPSGMIDNAVSRIAKKKKPCRKPAT